MRPRACRIARLAGLSVPLVAWGACRAQSGNASPAECAPAASDLPAGSTAEGLAGEYQLRLVATSGMKAGSTSEGTLTLKPQPRELRYRIRPGGATDSAVVHPVYGTAEVDLKALDAVEVGTTTSGDPRQPGVLVIERHQRSGEAPRAEIVLRLGSEANRRDRQRVDGGYTALRVRQIRPEGFSGTWASGIMREQAGGYFCAVREDG